MVRRPFQIMASRRKEKQKRKDEKRQLEERQAEESPAVPGVPRVMCSACREAERDASTLFYIIECEGCPGGCGGDHLALICSACGAPSAVMAEDLIASMVDPATCAACGKVFDMGKGGGGVGTNIGAPPGVDELYYCPLCAF